MIRWLARTSINRLRRMLQAIRMRDLSINFATDHLRGSERKLAEEINEVISDFRDDMLRQERQYGQYEAILNIVDSALIVADADGNVKWMNKRAIDNLCGFQISHLSMLDALHPGLADSLMHLRPGHPRIASLMIAGCESQLRMSVATYRHEGIESCIYSIENVNLLMQQSEVDAQRKLVSVLTHEIMNSLSPIISLSDTLCENARLLDDESVMALHAINRRSQGLLKFVQNYRQLTRISQPVTRWTRIGEIFDNLRALFPAEYIIFDVEDSDIQLQLDSNQIEQVLINLIKNATEACADTPAVSVSTKANHPKHQFLISVADNGCGISPDAIDNIFVPFFTTKQGGSGIGLSLSRQIISLHGGTISVDTSAHGSTFTITLPLVYQL